MWWYLYLQRPFPLPVFSYFAVLGTFLGINLWAVVCTPQPITVRRMWSAGCGDQLPDRKHVGPPEACAFWVGEEGPTLNGAFTNSNGQILLVMPLKNSGVNPETLYLLKWKWLNLTIITKYWLSAISASKHLSTFQKPTLVKTCVWHFMLLAGTFCPVDLIYFPFQ